MRIRTTALIMLAVAMTAIPASANDAVRIYARILSEAETLQQKMAIVTTMIALNEPESAPYLSDALDEALAIRSNIKQGPDMEMYERYSRLLLKSLGDFRYTNAASSAMRAVEDSSDALTKAEALIALGSMRAVEYAEKVSLILRDLNLQPTRDAEAGEKIAYGAVLALERMRAPIGFAPLFFASEGWYQKRVRDQAMRSLPLVLDDPSDAVMALLLEETPDRMVKALNLELTSKAPTENKAKVASKALDRGLLASPKNKTDEVTLAQLCVNAMNALAVSGPGNGSNAPNLAQAYRLGSFDERLVALKAMGADKSVEAAKEMSAIILDLNSQQMAGRVTDANNNLMKAAMQNAAINARKELLPAIDAVIFNKGWSSGVLTLASQARKALQ